jgi:hypothetical protein
MNQMQNPDRHRAHWLVRLAQPSAIGIAFATSILLHVVMYWVTPRFATTFTPTKPVQYDASLVPLESLPAAKKVSETRVVNGSRINTRSEAPAETQPRRTTPKSATDFAAPENTMPVAAATVAPTPEPTAAPTSVPTEAAEGRPGEGSRAGGIERPSTTQSGDPSTGTAATNQGVPVPADPPVPSAVAPPLARRAPAFAERISIEYKLMTAITDGVASFRWTRRGAEYEIESSIQATGFLVSAFAGVIHQKSRGTITEDGLRPREFSIRRGEGEAELAEFRHSANTLAMKRNGETRSVPLPRDMQDMQSFLFQLAYDAPYLAESGDKLDVLITNARKVYRYQFRKLGAETLDTRFGPIETVRLLSEAANPEDQYEVWLAPGYFYLPMKLKYYLGRFQVEQLVTRIGVSGEVTAR